MFLEALFLAWVLSWFHFDEYFVHGMYELFRLQISVYGYYVIFFLAGLALDILRAISPR